MKPNSLRCTNCMGNLVTLSHPLDPKRRNMCIKCANKETMKKLKQAEWEEIEKKTMKEAQKQKIPHHLIEHTIDRWKVDLSGLIYDMVNHRPNMELGYIPNYKDITNLIDSELSRQRAEIVEEMGKKPTTPPVKQTQGWEKRFDAKFVMDNGVEWKGKNGQWAGEDGPDIDAIKDFIASQRQELVKKIRIAERHALDKSYKKYGVLNYDYNNGVFEMRFELEDILSALEKEGKKEEYERSSNSGNKPK